ncbi:unnamed protein product [Schistosoma margrebowiei]|uniref:STIL N-terminal domain-containing protein n=1 Tax=Schistosoma margrebowiei TaxID=48269 RepID=A0AA85ACR3_9TREM|nr:unnamed protein product [Schistosoma margrebowiei]
MASHVNKGQDNDTMFSFGSVSSQCSVKCMIPKKVCKLAYRMITQCRQNSLKTYLYGRYSFVGVSSLNVIVNRIELNKQYCQSNIPDEFLIPFKLAKYDISSSAESQSIDCAIQAIWNDYTLKPLSLDITNCIQFWAYACVTKNSNNRDGRINKPQDLTTEMYFSKFKVECLVLDYSLNLTPIGKPSLVSSLLVKSLETPNFHLSEFTESLNDYGRGSEVRFGYLNITNTGKISLHLDTDPTILTSSPIGIWISGVKGACDFRIWKACLQFLLINETETNRLVKSDYLGYMNSTNNSPMLLAVYLCDSSSPRFYETSIVYSHETDTCDSSVYMRLHRNSKDPMQLKFTLLSSLEDSVSLSKSSFENSEYFTWNLVKNISPKENLTILKDSVKQFCDAVNAIPTLFSAISQISARCVSENQNSMKSNLNSHLSSGEFKNLDLSESNILEASLLSEEGVKTLYQNSRGSHSYRITSEQLDEESFPREHPRKSNGFIKSGESSDNNFNQEDTYNYDPNRYRNFPNPVTSSASVSPVSTTSTPNTGCTVSIGPKAVFSEIHSRFDIIDITMHFLPILSDLPMNQLERLEKIIANMLGKKKIGCLASDASKNGLVRGNNQDCFNKHDIKRGISIGVNTTFVSSRTSFKNKEQLSCDSLNNQDVQSSVCTRKSSFINDSLSVVQHHNNNANYSRQDVFANYRPILQLKSSSPVHLKGIKKGELPMDSQYQSDTSDKYSWLLANIQQVLNNRMRCDSAASAPHPDSNNITKIFFNQELRTSNSIPIVFHEKDDCVNYRVNSDKNPENFNRRVSNWLQSDPNKKGGNPLSSATKVNDTELTNGNYKRTDTHTYVDPSHSTNQLNVNQKLAVPESIQDIHLVNVKKRSENFLNSGCAGDTDQSIYLSSLVNKYLGNKAVGNGTVDTDSSIVVDYSLATLDYMKRHGIIECHENDKCKQSTAPVINSTPTPNHKNALHNYTCFKAQRDDSVCTSSSDPSSSIPFVSMDPKSPDIRGDLTSGESLPNIMNELGLGKLQMTQHAELCNPDTKYLSTLSDCSSEKDTSIRPTLTVSEYSHIFDYEPNVINSPILDLERLRSLPKLL